LTMIRTRSGNVGIMTTLILMFSIVLFIGTLLWLVADVGFLGGTPGSSLFKPATTSKEGPRTLNQTIIVLQQNGCEVVYYTEEYAGGYEQVSYEVFKETAIASKVVYRLENPENVTVLLVENQGKILEWAPDS
jgi:hypothetical protein